MYVLSCDKTLLATVSIHSLLNIDTLSKNLSNCKGFKLHKSNVYWFWFRHHGNAERCTLKYKGQWLVNTHDWPCCLFSSPEPSGSQGELILYPCSGVRCRCRRRCRRRQQCLNIFSSETALPIKAKLYVEPPWEGGTKVYINGPGHMTKMAAMPIYGKNL